MTLDEIAYNLLNLVRGGRSSHDEHISLDQIKFNVIHYRAVYIRRDYAKNGFVSRHIEQDLGCVPIIPVDASKCCKIETNCPVYRTVIELPKTIRYNFEEAISHVGDVSGIGTIPIVNSNTIQWLAHDKYTKNKMKAYMIANYLYIYNAEGLETINVRGVFENPQEVSNFDMCEEGGCYNDSAHPFPIPMDMLSLINQGLLNGELNMLANTASDTSNDRLQESSGALKSKPQPQG